MPGRQLGSAFEATNGSQGVATSLLKRHKTLPRPKQDRFPDFYVPSPVTKPRDLAVDTRTPSIPSSDTSSPRTLKHASKRIGVLPPTPPSHSRQSSGSHSIPVAAPKFDLASITKDAPTTPGTPPNQRSPPTPDVTPPRAMPLAFRAPNTRYPSSRTDSFKTARENPYSSDEDEVSTVRPVLPSAKTSATEIPQILPKPPRTPKRKAVGLGLGLESDNEGTSSTPKPTEPISPRDEFVIFDGDWASAGDTVEVEREWDDNLMRNVVVRKRPGRVMQMFEDGGRGEVLEDNLITPTMATKAIRDLPLHDQIGRHRSVRDTANRLPADNFAGRIAWPQPASSYAEPESPSLPDSRRYSSFSGPSAKSTVIEAMVLDAPPSRQKTLRHTRKHLGLRDLGSDQSTRSSGPESVTSSEPRHRLHHSSTKLPDRRHQSVTSTTTISTTSSGGLSRKAVIQNGAIPVVLVPQRKSSVKSVKTPSLRSTSSRRTKRSLSLNSGPQSDPLSAPLSSSSKYNEPGYFDTLQRRKRTLSESAGSGHSVRTIDFPPNIPQRRSSLSAPTSRDASRAGSLTAESLNAHNMIIQQKSDEAATPKAEQQSHPSAAVEKDTGFIMNRHVDHNGDPFFGNRLSTQVTPFSVTSYETAATTAEVSEALAVSIFPHQNKSVLVVQQKAPSDSSSVPTPPNAPPSMTVNGQATTGPVTPPQPIHPMDEVDSPLRNPRDPPEPPVIKFIPATPSGLTPSQEEERQLGHGMYDGLPPDDAPKRTMSLMRRLSSRRGPEITPQRPGFLTRTFSLSGRQREASTQTSKPEANPKPLYPTVNDQPQDGTKLHPFWRPANFWDDLEDDDNWGRDGDEGYPPVDNRPKPQRTFSQKLKRTFAILPVQDDEDERYYNPPHRAHDRRVMKRSSNERLRVVKQRSNSSLTRYPPSVNSNFNRNPNTYTGSRSFSDPSFSSAQTNQQSQPFGYGFQEGNGGKSRGHVIPGLGLRVEYVGFSGLKRRMSEKRREKLRGSISGPRGVRGGVDDVLRKRGEGSGV